MRIGHLFIKKFVSTFLTGHLVLIANGVSAEVQPILASQCETMHAKGVVHTRSPVGCERLKKVSFSYIDFNEQIQIGEVIVLDIIAQRVQAIFDTLYKQRFPIHKAVPIEYYNGNDTASMNDNNTSAFNGRPITGGSRWSLHAYGVAIDINPYQNPYLSFEENGMAKILPAESAKLAVNRMRYRPVKPVRQGLAEEVIDVFAQNGFLGWGGYWDFPIDYQHFEVGPRLFVEQLITLPIDEAQRNFERYIADYTACILQAVRQPHEEARAFCIAKIYNHFLPKNQNVSDSNAR